MTADCFFFAFLLLYPDVNIIYKIIIADSYKNGINSKLS